MIDEEGKNLNLRGLLQFKKGKSIPLDEVESVDKIVQRFKQEQCHMAQFQKKLMKRWQLL